MSGAEVEQMMNPQDVILKPMAKKISWLEAAELGRFPLYRCDIIHRSRIECRLCVPSAATMDQAISEGIESQKLRLF